MRKILPALVAGSMVMAATAWAASTPAAVTGSATAVTNHSVVLHANINPEGQSTSYVFQYGLTSAYGSQTGTRRAGQGSKYVPAQLKIDGLSPGTTYHYRVEAGNKLGSTFSRDRKFTTSGHPLPGAITGLPTSVGSTTVTLAGTVVTQNQTTSFVFQYGTSTSYGLQTATANATASRTPTGVSYTVPGLSPATTYHYRLVANHNGSAVEYGQDQSFTTLPLHPLPAQLRTHTTPSHARHKPYVFTTSGSLVPPSSLPAGVGCTGHVRIRFLRGRHTVAFVKTPLQANCTFSAQVTIRHKKVRLRVDTTFGGNSYIATTGGPRHHVNIG